MKRLTEEQITALEQALLKAMEKSITKHIAWLRESKPKISVGYNTCGTTAACGICTGYFDAEVGPHVIYATPDARVEDLVCPDCVNEYAPELWDKIREHKRIEKCCEDFASFLTQSNCVECMQARDADGRVITGTVMECELRKIMRGDSDEEAAKAAYLCPNMITIWRLESEKEFDEFDP